MQHNNFGDLIWRAVSLFPERVAIEQGDLTLTYGELEERTQKTARLLSGLDVGKGTRVLLFLPNDYRFVEALLGVLRTGAEVVPVNIKLGVEALTFIANHSEATVLIGHVDLLEKITTVQAGSPYLKHVLIIGGEAPGYLAYDALLDQTQPGWETVDVGLGDVALVMYTSGSTGPPKGCLLSHANKWWQARSSARTFYLDEWDKALITGPLYHANALWSGMLPMLFVGGGMAILPGFDAVAVLEAIDRYRPTYTSGTPSMFTLLLAQREVLARVDVSSINYLCCGSAPVPEELIRALHEKFGCEVIESYGLTEGGANVVAPRWGIKKLGSTGLPVPGVKLRIVDLEDSSRECPPGVIGELWSMCPANAIGYLKQPEVTAQKFTADGWLKTGDLVKADEQGYIYFCGRKDDMINVGGENVYPKEVETVLLAHPEIDDVCVVSVNHKVKGQAPVAWVVLSRPGALTEDVIKQFFLENGPAYAHPRRVFFLDRLPVSGTNKLDRKFLEEEARRLMPDGIGGGA
ncbi:MAG: long-chain fatty acid--CoA ligase [Firmicutes bacterium]|nr:long-chain fatty acid--CoA ligase [Bacillota bacterium]